MQMTLNGSTFLLIHRSLIWHMIIAFKTSSISQTGKEHTCTMSDEKQSSSLSRIVSSSPTFAGREQYLLEKQKMLQTGYARHPLRIQGLLLLAQHRNTMNWQRISNSHLAPRGMRHFMKSWQAHLASQLIIHLQASLPKKPHWFLVIPIPRTHHGPWPHTEAKWGVAGGCPPQCWVARATPLWPWGVMMHDRPWMQKKVWNYIYCWRHMKASESKGKYNQELLKEKKLPLSRAVHILVNGVQIILL